MTEYYRLCLLEESRSIDFEQEGLIRVDLDMARGQQPVTSDEQLVRTSAPGTYFWISGGGSLLLEGRHLILVERSGDSRINPGKLSLCTGRADNEAEWADPRLLLRELFEELQIVNRDGEVRLPWLSPGWVDAPSICRASCERLGQRLATAEDVSLDLLPLENSRVEISSGGVTHTHDLLLHVSERRDVNALYVLQTDLTLDSFWAMDGEADETHQRRIFALDLATLSAVDVTFGSTRNVRRVEEEGLTEHCQFLIRNLRRRTNSRANSDHRGILPEP